MLIFVLFNTTCGVSLQVFMPKHNPVSVAEGVSLQLLFWLTHLALCTLDDVTVTM